MTMCDLPENLQVIKRELSPPSTPEDNSPNNIKAKLNLHVKRRLHDFANHLDDVNIEIPRTSSANTDAKPKLEPQKKETIRQKRPYQKRTEKINKSAAQSHQSLDHAITGVTTLRKYKHKLKQIVTTGNPESLTPNSVDESLNTAGAVSAGDDDDGGHDNDMRTSREKEKCPDVLAMVLSLKKRSLMQDPEVHKFLKDVLEVIKS